MTENSRYSGDLGGARRPSDSARSDNPVSLQVPCLLSLEDFHCILRQGEAHVFGRDASNDFFPRGLDLIARRNVPPTKTACRCRFDMSSSDVARRRLFCYRKATSSLALSIAESLAASGMIQLVDAICSPLYARAARLPALRSVAGPLPTSNRNRSRSPPNRAAPSRVGRRRF